MTTKKVLLFLADGFEEIEALTPVDILRRAGVHVDTVSVGHSLSVEGAHQIYVMADKMITDVDFESADMLILPGGMPGTENLDESDLLKKKIEHHYKHNKPLAAICAAPMILGKMGLLKGRQATCYPGYEQYLEGATVVNSKVVTSDGITTAQGVGAAIDFALELVTILVSKHKAEELAKKMVIHN